MYKRPKYAASDSASDLGVITASMLDLALMFGSHFYALQLGS
jgi:hypothetical protein